MDENKSTIEYWEQEKADTIKAMGNMDGVGVVNNQGYSQYDVMCDYLDYIEEQIQEAKAKMEVKEYREFMCNKDNSHCCADCPENMNYNGCANLLPCGQQNCWVDITCDREVQNV